MRVQIGRAVKWNVLRAKYGQLQRTREPGLEMLANQEAEGGDRRIIATFVSIVNEQRKERHRFAGVAENENRLRETLNRQAHPLQLGGGGIFDLYLKRRFGKPVED